MISETILDCSAGDIDLVAGAHYNYFRDYEPGIGRYVQSDPIGLEGGTDTFGFVGGSPLINVDPDGLDYWIENAADTEQKCPEQGCGAHQSFCVGKPYGKRFCISFGRMGGQGWCLRDCKGRVYEDRSPVGPIDQSSYRSSGGATDRKIEQKLRPRLKGEGRYDFIGFPGNNCRTFSQALFDEIDKDVRGNATAPPAPPRSGPPTPRGR